MANKRNGWSAAVLGVKWCRFAKGQGGVIISDDASMCETFDDSISAVKVETDENPSLNSRTCVIKFKQKNTGNMEEVAVTQAYGATVTHKPIWENGSTSKTFGYCSTWDEVKKDIYVQVAINDGYPQRLTGDFTVTYDNQNVGDIFTQTKPEGGIPKEVDLMVYYSIQLSPEVSIEHNRVIHMTTLPKTTAETKYKFETCNVNFVSDFDVDITVVKDGYYDAYDVLLDDCSKCKDGTVKFTLIEGSNAVASTCNRIYKNDLKDISHKVSIGLDKISPLATWSCEGKRIDIDICGEETENNISKSGDVEDVKLVLLTTSGVEDMGGGNYKVKDKNLKEFSVRVEARHDFSGDTYGTWGVTTEAKDITINLDGI